MGQVWRLVSHCGCSAPLLVVVVAVAVEAAAVAAAAAALLPSPLLLLLAPPLRPIVIRFGRVGPIPACKMPTLESIRHRFVARCAGVSFV